MSLRFQSLSLLLITAAVLSGCQREDRDYRGPPPPSGPQAGVSPTTLSAGGQAQVIPKDARALAYETNAFHISEGKRYYEQFNCYGCHAAGGGDIGPALMDDRWLYGGEIAQIHASIAEGRPNGMPSFRRMIPDDQIWEISAYVRSMSGNVPKSAAGSRGDEIQDGPPKTQLPSTPVHPSAGVDQPQ